MISAQPRAHREKPGEARDNISRLGINTFTRCVSVSTRVPDRDTPLNSTRRPRLLQAGDPMVDCTTCGKEIRAGRIHDKAPAVCLKCRGIMCAGGPGEFPKVSCGVPFACKACLDAVPGPAREEYTCVSARILVRSKWLYNVFFGCLLVLQVGGAIYVLKMVLENCDFDGLIFIAVGVLFTFVVLLVLFSLPDLLWKRARTLFDLA